MQRCNRPKSQTPRSRQNICQASVADRSFATPAEPKAWRSYQAIFSPHRWRSPSARLTSAGDSAHYRRWLLYAALVTL
ncbi:hypothetical protein KCP77_03805 [Salmonella enterica subsp. enterica]|nr:hypothetical protein KCP77_03805 [Salmonella enterica subsp. enterica]